MNDLQIDDFLDRLDRLASEVGVKKLMKLSKAEILTLAKHYEIACAEEYFEGKQWRLGKADLCHELYECLLSDGRM